MNDMTSNDNAAGSFLIAGIGASAGGLEALQRFLSALPRDFGFALVFVQHLSSKHKSLLPELLSARIPSLVIQEISDGLKAQPGRLYLSPPGKEIRLRNGLFQTTVHPEGLIHLPIDEFFSSLAEDAGDRSIAVIFSGAGTDGARGCQAIRSAGGAVFVQDPLTAEFDSMPLAALATGQADAVLSPEDICRELLKLQGIGAAAVSREQPITPGEFEAFFKLLQEKTGSRFNHYKKSVVGRRIRRRMYLHGISTVKDYLDFISSNDAEAAHLASDLMIGVTSFFRDRVAWKALNLEAVRKIVAENTDLPVRVWTPASATGEEAYSIAMMLRRELDLAGKRRDVQVFATDVNDRALERAREGKYPASISADVPQENIQKHFTSGDDGNCLVINKDVRESVVFAKQDLLTDPPFSKLDLIICRNFMIYLEPEAQEKCIRLFHYALKEGGFLFLGNAETVGRNSKLFQSIGRKQCRIYRKLETKPASRLPLSVPYATERQAAPPARLTQIAGQGKSTTEIVQEKLLEEYGPASVAIDQNYEIIYHNGPTNRYLHQPRGVPTQNLLELLPDNLRSRIRGAIYRSSREERPVVIRTSVAGDDNRNRQVSLRFTKAAENLSIVVFQEKGAPSREEAAEEVDASFIEETAIHQLESELSATRADLQSHIEQLKSLNEELQSSNEELQAANEELETSREELQSLNEELITVNSQLQGKIEEQDVTNNDLNNFLASTNIPTIFLDTHFRVKRFTPAMLRLIKLLPSDVGRPIVDMSQENLGPDLTSDAQSVLESLVPARQELELSGAWYVRTTLPYRTADNRIEGVVITYNDVTELKKSEERTKHLASFPELNPNPVCEVHASGKVNFCNPATEKVLVSLGLGAEDLSVFLPEDMDDILRDLEKKEEASFYREKAIGDRVFGMTVHLAPQFNVVRIYAYDITERKKAEEAQGRLAAIVSSAEDAIISKDLDGVIQTWNVGAEKIFSYTAEEAIGKNISLLVPPGHADEMSDILKRLSQGEHIENFETVRMRKDGTVIPVSLNFSAIRDANGKVIGASKIAHDITERKRVEEALRESELRVRRKLESVLSPEGDIGNLELGDIIDPPALQSLVDNLYKFVHLPIGIIDLKGKVLVGVGWQDVCTKFHRAHPDACRHCTESDLELTRGVSPGEFKLYKCKNGMWDAVTPLMVGGQHMGNIFWGQFFFDDESVDRGFFRAQARKYGFNEDEYLAALDKVPRISRAALDTGMAFYLKLADMLSKLSYGNIKLAQTLSVRDALLNSLRESEERLKRAQEISHLGSWDLDLVNNRLTWSDEVYRIFGLQPQEFSATYEAFLEAVHPDDRAAVDASYSGSIRDGKDTYEIEHRMVRKVTGEIRYVHEKCQHFRDKTGKIIRSVGMVHDITERKLAEETIKKSMRRFELLSGTANEFLKAVDPHKTMESVCRKVMNNLDCHAFFNFLVDENAGKLHLNACAGIPEEEVKRIEWVDFGVTVCGCVARDGERIVAQHILTTPDERTELLKSFGIKALACHPLLGPGGKVIGTLAFGARGRETFSEEDLSLMKAVTDQVAVAMARMRNESEVLKLSEDMAARNVELETMNREMESFVYSISHDLRAPIRAMAGFAKIIVEDYFDKLDAQGRDYLNRILKGSEKSTQLIDDLLRLSKIARQDMDRIEVDLSGKASKIMEELRALNHGRNVEVAVQEGLFASADPGLIELALSNLLGNAWKFTSKTEKARIEFGAIDCGMRIAECGMKDKSKENASDIAVKSEIRNLSSNARIGDPQSEIVYYVKDNGAGFDPEYADKMFWPFHRLHSENEFEGTGIGLAIVERVIRRHGGRVWAKGEVGKGVTVFFTLG
jgi:two-component system CheB/CheR fusion protein